ncbi:unnamed protein product [Colias eurytheme]|nr:unnamed protein product [Colias eurytheme]
MKVAAIIVACAISSVLGKNIQLNENGCPADYKIEQLYPHSNCNMFYQCFHGELVEHKCAHDLYFSVEKQECDYQSNVDCGDRHIPEPEDSGNDGGNDNGGNDNGGNGNDGNGSCNCSPGEAPSICDGNDNDNDGENDNGGNDNGGNDNGGNDNNGNGSCNCNPGEAPSICGEAPSICAKDGSDGVLVAHEKCNKFYKCFTGLPFVMKCPENTLYNPYKKYCDWPGNVKCGDRVIPDGNDNDNNDGEAPSICGKDRSDGVLVAHENCNQFYKCAHGVPVVQNCSGTLLYNPYKEYCDWPQNVECGDRVIPDCNDNGNNGGNDNGGNDNNDNGSCNCNPAEAPSICAKKDSSGVLIAHEICNQFYTCDHGVPVTQKCPGILLYNPHKTYCDWPQNVKCGDRIILH